MACSFSNRETELLNLLKSKQGIKSTIGDLIQVDTSTLFNLDTIAHLDPEQVIWEINDGALNSLVSNLGRERNTDASSIPAGYSYLGQLITHDIVPDSAKPTSRQRPNFSSALDLSSVYPDVIGNKNNKQLRFGKLAQQDPYSKFVLNSIDENGYFKFSTFQKDPKTDPQIGQEYIPTRVLSKKRSKSGVETKSDLGEDLPRGVFNGINNFPRVPETRNDENKIISQLHVLFQRLHNKAIELIIDGHDHPEKIRNYHRARTFVTLIFQRIVVDDYLPRIIPPNIWNAFFSRKTNPGYFLSKPSSDKAWLVPIEFSHAAFRFGHSMILDEYRLNKSPIIGVKKLSQLLNDPKARERVKESEAVDWTNFFSSGREDTHLNKASRIDLQLVSFFAKSDVFGDIETGFRDSLKNRDNEINDELKQLDVEDKFRNLLVKGLIKLDLLSSKNAATADMLIKAIKEHEGLHQTQNTSLSSPPKLSTLLNIELLKSIFRYDSPAVQKYDLPSLVSFTSTRPDKTSLWLYFLFEAELYKYDLDLRESSADYLGPLGSWVISEVILNAIKESRSINMFMSQKKINQSLGLVLGKAYRDFDSTEGKISMKNVLDFLNN